MPFTNKYPSIESFSEGMAPVMSKSYKWGFIDKDGKEVIRPQYDGINGNFGGVYGFSQGLVGMKKKVRNGAILLKLVKSLYLSYTMKYVRLVKVSPGY